MPHPGYHESSASTGDKPRLTWWSLVGYAIVLAAASPLFYHLWLIANSFATDLMDQ